MIIIYPYHSSVDRRGEGESVETLSKCGLLASFPHRSSADRDVSWVSHNFIVLCCRTCSGHLALAVGVVVGPIRLVRGLGVLVSIVVESGIGCYRPPIIVTILYFQFPLCASYLLSHHGLVGQGNRIGIYYNEAWCFMSL